MYRQTVLQGKRRRLRKRRRVNQTVNFLKKKSLMLSDKITKSIFKTNMRFDG